MLGSICCMSSSAFSSLIIFFFSSRRRHTRCSRDWSSDVCSSDLEPPQTGSRTAHVDWPSPTLPWLAVAFKGPAYSDETKDKPALDLLREIAFGENSDIYRRLVLEQQKVDDIGVDFGNHPDPELFTAYARIKDVKDVDDVREQVLATF